jgi:hypothetical protein
MKRILICGGRDYNNKDKVYEILDKALSVFSDLHIIHGAASGADSLAGDWANERQMAWTAYPANWNEYGKRAGYIRNTQMLNEGKPDLVIAFPGGKGTQMMINLAEAAKVPVKKV